MQTDTSTPTAPEKRARGPLNGSPVFRHQTLPMVNAGPGLTAAAHLPQVAGRIVRVQVEGVRAEHVAGALVTVGGLTVLNVQGYTDRDTGEHRTGGQVLADMARLDGLRVSPEVVPLFHIPETLDGFKGADMAPAPALVLVELNDSARWGATLRVIWLDGGAA